MSMQSIFVEGLRVEARIGVGARERGAPQTLVIDLEVGVPDDRAGRSDRLADTIDYAAVAEVVRRECAAQRHRLLERLARQLCEAIEREFPAQWIRVRIAKTGIVPDTDRVGVVMERGARNA